MTITIEDPELVRELERSSAAAEEGLDSFIIRMLREKLVSAGKQVPAVPRRPIDWEAVRNIQEKIKALPVLDGRDPDQMIGYDENGLFER